jgi:hypothetical protein
MMAPIAGAAFWVAATLGAGVAIPINNQFKTGKKAKARKWELFMKLLEGEHQQIYEAFLARGDLSETPSDYPGFTAD